MNKQQFKQMVRDQIIKEIFGIGELDEDTIPAEEPEPEELDNLEPAEPEIPEVPQNLEPEKEPEPEPEKDVIDQPDDPNVMRVSKIDAVDIVLNTKGRVFTCLFTKKDGTDRIMNCRLGVKKYLTGGGLKWNPEERGYLPVYDMQKRAYRMINFNTMKMIKVGKMTYDVR